MKNKLFYRYINKHGKGYQIRKDGEHYGWYEDLPDCLYDRDRLEQCDWDIQTWTELPEVPNPYKHMELPPFEKRKASYITHIPERWRVQKVIKGKLVTFGTYDNYEDAEARRNQLLLEGFL